MGPDLVAQILEGSVEDPLGLQQIYSGLWYSHYSGLVLIWLAAALTLITGADYFRKAWPYVKDG